MAQKQKKQDAYGIVYLLPVPLAIQAVDIITDHIVQCQCDDTGDGEYAAGPSGFVLPGAKEQIPKQRDDDQDIGQHEAHIIGIVCFHGVGRIQYGGGDQYFKKE